MSEHYQINIDGTTSLRETTLWPSDKDGKRKFLEEIFERNGWKISSLQNVGGSFWKLEVASALQTLKINLYISSIRDESRQADEFKMQLGTSYPTSIEKGWITLVLGIYTPRYEATPSDCLLAGYDWTKYDFSGNPSIRGTRTSGLQKAYLNGYYKSDLCVIFRPDFIYYYINSFANSHDKGFSEPRQLPANVSLQKIYYGAPGTGKSHATQEIADKYNDTIRTTFHPDSDYSTFVGAYKPTMADKEIHRNPTEPKSVVELANILKYYFNNNPQGSIRGLQKFCFEYGDYLNGNKAEYPIEQVLKAALIDLSLKEKIEKYLEYNELLPKTDRKIEYKFVKQAFIKAYIKAWKKIESVENIEDAEPQYLVIEEINRGNCAQIFGDLFQLLDRKNGFSEYPIEPDHDITKALFEEKPEDGLSFGKNGLNLKDKVKESIKANYNEEIAESVVESVCKGQLLVLPSNFYIWATMNTSDQSLFPIDSAFKRRWDWQYVPIKDAKKNWRIMFDYKDGEEKKIIEVDWWEFLEEINKRIYDATKSEDKQLGYFFCKPTKYSSPDIKGSDDGPDIITAETFVNKVIFYLWQDVFKVSNSRTSLFNSMTFHDFYLSEEVELDDNENTMIDHEKVAAFINNVMSDHLEKEKA